LRKQLSHSERRVCVLESVREDDIETARGKVAQRILEICGRLRLHQCGLDIQTFLDLLQTLVRRRVPACIAHRAWCEQRDLESVGAGGRRSGLTARGDTERYYQREPRTCRLEEPPQSAFRQNYTSHAFSCIVDYQSPEG